MATKFEYLGDDGKRVEINPINGIDVRKPTKIIPRFISSIGILFLKIGYKLLSDNTFFIIYANKDENPYSIDG